MTSLVSNGKNGNYLPEVSKCLLPLLTFNIVMEILANTIMQNKNKNKKKQEEIKLIVCKYCDYVHRRSTNKL